MSTFGSQVALVKGDERYPNVIKALELIKNEIDPSLIKNKRVLIKPNFVSSSKLLAATHPDAVKAVINFIQEFDPAKITIAEATADGNTMDAYRNFGYHELKGVELFDINNDTYEMIKIRTLDDEPRMVRVSKTVLDSDYKISVARAKTHDHLICTLTCKNMMGCVPHIDHVWIHGASEEPISPKELAIKSNYILANNLISIIKKVDFDLGVVDGIVGMEGDGPVDGTSIKLGIVAAGTDCVAVDSVMTHVMGFEPNMKAEIFLAAEKGIGILDLSKIDIMGEDIDNVKMSFKPHTNYLDTQLGWKQHHVYT